MKIYDSGNTATPRIPAVASFQLMEMYSYMFLYNFSSHILIVLCMAPMED